jgi:hypothetical protein
MARSHDNGGRRSQKRTEGKERIMPVVKRSKTFLLFVETAVNIGLIVKRESYPVPALKHTTKWYTTLKAERDFVRLLGHGVEDAHVLLLLALLPNLEHLYIDGYTPYPALDWNHFLSRISASLSSLRDFIFVGSPTKPIEPVVWTDLRFLDLLPNLQQLRISNVFTTFPENSPKALASKAVKLMKFAECALDLKLLQKLLAEQQISYFTYGPGTGGEYPTNAADQYFLGSIVAEYLASSSQSLRNLELFTMVPGNGPVFATFPNLTFMEMPQPGFLSSSDEGEEDDPATIAGLLRKQLPSSLEKLSLRFLSYTAELKIFLEQIAQLKLQGVLNRLHTMYLNFSYVRLSGGLPVVWHPVDNSEAKLRRAWWPVREGWHPTRDLSD